LQGKKSGTTDKGQSLALEKQPQSWAGFFYQVCVDRTTCVGIARRFKRAADISTTPWKRGGVEI